MSWKLSVFLLLSVCQVASGQLVTVSDVVCVESIDQVTSVTIDLDGDGFNDIPSEPTSVSVSQKDRPAKLITINTSSTVIRADFEDLKRNRKRPQKLSATQYLVTEPGDYWLDVLVRDFDKKLDDSTDIQFTVGPPKPEIDESVDNAYGVGRVASACPIHRDAVANIFEQAGNFLYGQPTLKTIRKPNDPAYRDANVSVLQWIADQFSSLPCPSEAECVAFKSWQTEVNKAIYNSQENRQFTREDWFNVFKEIKKAVK